MKAWGLLGLGVCQLLTRRFWLSLRQGFSRNPVYSGLLRNICAKLKGVKPGAEDMKSQFYGCSDQGAYIAARPGDAMAHRVADYGLAG